MCPQLQADQNCTQECQSDAQCADNLKCCQAGCATICHLPDGNPGAPRAGPGRALCAGGGRAPGSGQGDAPAAPRDPCRVETDGTRPAVRSLSGPRDGRGGGTKASLKRSGGAGGREVPHPWPDSIPRCVTDFRASTGWKVFPEVRAPGSQFPPRLVGAAGKPGAGEWAGSQHLGRSGLSESLPWGVPQLWRKDLERLAWQDSPGFPCPDGKTPYRISGAPSPS